jgi:DNA-binding response OmpR family regulator
LLEQERVFRMKKKKLLIIDDERDLLLVLEKKLNAEGYSVVIADNGHDGIMLAKSYQPDLIILDVSMPDIDGGEVNRKLKDLPETKDIPVIFLTCLLEKEEEKRNGNVIGSNIFFAKPYDMEKLLKAIEGLLSGCISIRATGKNPHE